MNGSLFALVNGVCTNQIVAWGMEITFEDPNTDLTQRVAIVYRPDPYGKEGMQSKHASAIAACNMYNRILPINVELAWQTSSVSALPMNRDQNLRRG